jgi:hypothetical protein
VEAFSTIEEEISKIQHLDIESQIELVGEEIRTTKTNIDIKPLLSM